MQTALDVDRSKLDKQEQKFVDQVRKDGWFGTHIQPDSEGPGFSYTTGFWNGFGFPEVVAFALPWKAAHDIYWSIYRALAAGSHFPIGEPVEDLIKGYSVVFVPVAKSKYPEFLGWSRWFYFGDAFECVQMVWPDKEGRFPWTDDYSENFSESQPDLTEGQWAGAGRS